MLGTGPSRRVQGDMETQIHHLEKEAYCAVLRAFKAQSDAISWEKEGLITELRKELRVSDDEHRELLLRVNSDDVLHRIRDWRQAGGHQALAAPHSVNDMSSPTTSASRKKHRSVSLQPSPTGTTPGQRGRKPRQFPYGNHSTAGAREITVPGTGEQLVGRKVLMRWPEDNHFYEALITDYNPSDGKHMFKYKGPDNSFEWINVLEIPPEDIRWVDNDFGLSHSGGPGNQISMGHVSAAPGTGRGQFRSEQPNGMGKMSDDIEILHTDTLIKEVEKVVAASNPDRSEIENAKKMLKDHEQALIEAISRLTYVSDGDTGTGPPMYIR